MKLLIIGNSIRSESGVKNKKINGLNKILGDIYYSKHLKCEKYFFASSYNFSYIENSKTINNIPNKKYNFIFGINIIEIGKIIINSLVKFKKIRKTIIKELQFKYITNKINTIKPDIIHIHDLSDLHKDIIEYCISLSINCVLTLHIYIGKKSTLNNYKKLQSIENKTFNIKEIHKLYITTVSSTLSKRLLSDYPNISPEKTTTIINGTQLNIPESTYNIRKLYNIDYQKKIILCIGRLSERKNQIQILQAIKEMNPVEQKKFIVLCIGKANNSTKKILTNFIKLNGLENNFKIINPIPYSEIQNYYLQSDFVISASINEAFGLTFIEGFSFGLPAITFSDLDAITDLYNNRVMVTAEKRTSESLKMAIISAINKKWDNNYIKQYSQSFSDEKMVFNYLNLYQRILTNRIK